MTEKSKEGGRDIAKITTNAFDVTVLGGKKVYRYSNIKTEVLDYLEPDSCAERVKGRWVKFWIHLEGVVPTVETQRNEKLKEINLWWTVEEAKKMRDFLTKCLELSE